MNEPRVNRMLRELRCDPVTQWAETVVGSCGPRMGVSAWAQAAVATLVAATELLLEPGRWI